MSVQKTVREHLDDLKKLINTLADRAASGTDDIKQAAEAAKVKMAEINDSLDGVFDEALSDLRKSPYTAPILISIGVSVLLAGGFAGWLLRGWMGA